jgi:nucleoside triphosphatase
VVNGKEAESPRQKKKNKFSLYVMKRYPEPIAGAFIFNTKGELFLMKSHKWSDMYVIPGGHIELGETMNDALIRESKEETGLDVYDPEFICFWEFIEGEEFHEKKHMIFFNYSVKTKDIKVVLNDEGQEYLWVLPKESLKLPLNSYTRKTLEQYILKDKKQK